MELMCTGRYGFKVCRHINFCVSSISCHRRLRPTCRDSPTCHTCGSERALPYRVCIATAPRCKPIFILIPPLFGRDFHFWTIEAAGWRSAREATNISRTRKYSLYSKVTYQTLTITIEIRAGDVTVDYTLHGNLVSLSITAEHTPH